MTTSSLSILWSSCLRWRANATKSFRGCDRDGSLPESLTDLWDCFNEVTLPIRAYDFVPGTRPS
eukprot:3938762-Rhodomonas_salina.2